MQIDADSGVMLRSYFTSLQATGIYSHQIEIVHNGRRNAISGTVMANVNRKSDKCLHAFQLCTWSMHARAVKLELIHAHWALV